MKKILCPIDSSPGSRAALDMAMYVAGKFGTELHVLHVWYVAHHVRPDLSVWMEAHGQQPIQKLIASTAEAETEAFLSKLPPAERARLKVHVVEGEPWRTIVDTAKSEPFDLITMGTHGRSALARFALGSVAERVVRHAPCPVLTVPSSNGTPQSDRGASAH